MNKKIMLLALAAVSATLFALPAMASALEPLHLSPTPSGVKTVDDTGEDPKLSTVGGTTITCDSFSGTATFNEGGTTGSLHLKFGPNCRTFGIPCNSAGLTGGNITTTTLPFHLVTLANSKPGVLVTPNNSPTNEHFATFSCFGVQSVVKGNGVIGTIEQECGTLSNKADINFNAPEHGVQEHKTVAGTETEYDLRKGEETAAQDATGTVTFNENIKLECT